MTGRQVVPSPWQKLPQGGPIYMLVSVPGRGVGAGIDPDQRPFLVDDTSAPACLISRCVRSMECKGHRAILENDLL